MWNQTTSTVEITVELPANTRGRDVRVTVDDGALTVWTSWHGVVEGLSGALARRVKADETAWSVASDALEMSSRRTPTATAIRGDACSRTLASGAPSRRGRF